MFGQDAVLVFGDDQAGIKSNVVLDGHVYDEDTGEPVPEAVLQLTPTNKFSISEEDGSYKLVMPAGKYRLKIAPFPGLEEALMYPS